MSLLGAGLGLLSGGAGSGGSNGFGGDTQTGAPITFGSVNFKSDGAGDRSKANGQETPGAAFAAAMPAGNVVWIVLGVVAVAVLALFAFRRPKKSKE